MFGTGNNATGTPLDFYAEIDKRAGGFVCDMAADKLLTLHEQWYGPDHDDPARRDCLSVDWPTNGPVWLNPPYGDPEMPCKRFKKTGELNCKKKRCRERGWHTDVYIPGCVDFIRKAAEERLRGVETWALIAARTDVEWWHEYIWEAEYVHWPLATIAGPGPTCYGRPRRGVHVEFLRGRLVFRRDGQPDPAPFPSALVVFRP
jgi:hypothetical protein